MRTILILLSLLLMPLAGAQPPQNAGPATSQGSGYEGRVVVADQSDAVRDEGLGQALAQVLERVSGQPAASPQLLPLLTRAPRLVQRYGYERDPATGQLMLAASFDPRGVDSALRAQRLPVWGSSGAQAAEDVDLRIAGLRGIRDYGRSLAAVQAMPGVRRVSVSGADQSRLLLRVRVDGGSAALLAAPPGALVRVADADGGLVYSLTP
jgi:hypothetical protein